MNYEIIALYLKTHAALTINCELIWPGRTIHYAADPAAYFTSLMLLHE